MTTNSHDHETPRLTSRSTIALVGGGLAGGRAACELREQGFDGRLVLVGEEPELPYERPPLSKEYLRGESTRGQAAVRDHGFYQRHDVEVRVGTPASKLDPDRSELTLDDGERIRFDRLLLATGAAPRRLDVPGAQLGGVHHLRTIADCDALRADLRGAGRVLVVGAGWIGCEVAASARRMGLEVALADVAAQPLERVLGAELGAMYADLHAFHGVELVLGDELQQLQGVERVERAAFASGCSVDCDAVVAGIGVQPRVELAEGTPIAVGDGIETDERLETSWAGVFAAGDVAAVAHPLYPGRIRVEHWDAAREQGRVAARNMLGGRERYDRVPYFFSDQYDTGLEYWGRASADDEVVVRGDLGAGLVAVWLHGQRATAVMTIGRDGIAEHAEALIRDGTAVDPAAFRRAGDPVQHLAGLAAASRGAVSGGQEADEARDRSTLRRGEARVLVIGGSSAAAHRDRAGRLHVVSAECTHMGCAVEWDEGSSTWECPCHGARFQPDGSVVRGPAKRPLEPVRAPEIQPVERRA